VPGNEDDAWAPSMLLQELAKLVRHGAEVMEDKNPILLSR
jgi:hypothetical protein